MSYILLNFFYCDLLLDLIYLYIIYIITIHINIPTTSPTVAAIFSIIHSTFLQIKNKNKNTSEIPKGKTHQSLTHLPIYGL